MHIYCILYILYSTYAYRRKKFSPSTKLKKLGGKLKKKDKEFFCHLVIKKKKTYTRAHTYIHLNYADFSMCAKNIHICTCACMHVYTKQRVFFGIIPTDDWNHNFLLRLTFANERK